MGVDYIYDVGHRKKLASCAKSPTNEKLLASPSMSLRTIIERQNLVSKFLNDRALREGVVAVLRRTFDSQRLVQKFSMGRGDPDDLLSLFRTIEATNVIAGLLKQELQVPSQPDHKREFNAISCFESLQALSRRLNLEEPLQLASRIADAIDEDGLVQSHRLEETDAASLVSIAQGVLQSGASTRDKGASPDALRSKATTKATADQEADDVDTWIMRKQ